MSLFFSDIQNKKKALLCYLLFHNYSATTKELSLALNISAKSVTRYCQSLSDEFPEIQDGHLFKLVNDMGTIQLQFPTKAVPSYLLDNLSILYTQDSVKFNIIDALLSGNYLSISELADSLYLASTTIYTHLYQLESVLEQFDLSFNWERQEQGINFTYDEKKIRFFSLLFYWRFFKGIVPIKAQDFSANSDKMVDLHFSEDALLLKKKQLSYIIQITKWHLDQTRSVSLSSSNKKTIQLMTNVRDYSYLLEETELIEDEKLFFNLFTRMVISNMDDLVEKKEIVNALRIENSELFQLLTELHNYLIETFDCLPTEEDSIYYYYYMSVLFIYNDEIGIEIDNEFINSIKPVYYKNERLISTHTLKTIQEAHQKLIQSAGKKNINESIAIQICWNLLTSHYLKQKISLAISFSINPMGESAIKHRLLQIFNPDMLEFTDKITTADLVISDCTYLAESKQDFFYMKSLTDPICWDNLFDCIKNKLAHILL